MARLSGTKISGFDKRDGEDWDAYYARQEEGLNALAATSSAIPSGGDIEGALIKFSVADGYAHYVVTKASPLEVSHVPFGDGYEAPVPTIRGLNRDDVERQLAANRMWDRGTQRNDDFYSSLEEGQTVHWLHSFGAWIRCEAVRGKDSQTGEDRTVLKPVALVGDWRKHDLPKRNQDGSIRWGHQVKKIREGATMNPHESSIWESPRCAVRDRGAADPTGMEPIDVSGPPAMDEKEQEQARLWQLVARVREAVSTTLGEPRLKLQLVRAIMEQV